GSLPFAGVDPAADVRIGEQGILLFFPLVLGRTAFVGRVTKFGAGQGASEGGHGESLEVASVQVRVGHGILPFEAKPDETGWGAFGRNDTWRGMICRTGGPGQVRLLAMPLARDLR